MAQLVASNKLKAITSEGLEVNMEYFDMLSNNALEETKKQKPNPVIELLLNMV